MVGSRLGADEPSLWRCSLEAAFLSACDASLKHVRQSTWAPHKEVVVAPVPTLPLGADFVRLTVIVSSLW